MSANSTYLFMDFCPPRRLENRTFDQVNGASPFQPVLSDVATKPWISEVSEARQSFTRDPVYSGIAHGQRLNWDTRDDNFQDWLRCLPRIEPGCKLVLLRRIPIFHLMMGASVMVNCTDGENTDLSNFSVDLIPVDDLNGTPNPADPTTGIPLFADIPVSPASFGYTPIGVVNTQVDTYQLRVCIEPPYRDEDGYGHFGDECNPVPCMNFQVRLVMIDLCHGDKKKQCKYMCCPRVMRPACPQKEMGEEDPKGEENPKGEETPKLPAPDAGTETPEA